jgi:protoporphyrinogen oxidase
VPDVDPVLVLGGGPAGLATAWALEELQCPYLALEAAPVPGGNARTLRSGDFLYDTGPHRFHDRDPEATRRVQALLGPDLHEVRAPSRIFWHGRFVDFPLRPFQSLTAGGFAQGVAAVLGFCAVRLSRHRRADHGDFASWARDTFGPTIADSFLIPFSEKLWGLPGGELSPDISGRRLPGFTLYGILRDLLPGARAAHLEGRFLYPRRGYGQIVEAMASRLDPGRLRCGCRVVRVAAERNRIHTVEYVTDGQRLSLGASAVVNTLPITLLARILDPAPPPHILEAARRLRFREVVLVTLFLDQPTVSDAACIYFPQREFEFTRVHEPRNRSAEMSPPGKTSLVVELPCFEGDAVWTREDSALVAGVVRDLDRIGLIRAPAAAGSTVTRLSRAYPVYARDYRAASGAVLDHLRGFENLATLGRGGGFFYGHVHDFITEALATARAIVAARAREPAGAVDTLARAAP